jgi:hypothetical protein
LTSSCHSVFVEAAGKAFEIWAVRRQFGGVDDGWFMVDCQ